MIHGRHTLLMDDDSNQWDEQREWEQRKSAWVFQEQLLGNDWQPLWDKKYDPNDPHQPTWNEQKQQAEFQQAILSFFDMNNKPVLQGGLPQQHGLMRTQK